MAPEPISVINLHPVQSDARAEVLEGLSKAQKELPAKFFYDRAGSVLFEEITALPEYYLTRTEISILDEHAEEMVAMFGSSFALIEYGSGSSRKVRILLDQLSGHAIYMPVDISLLYLKESAEKVNDAYPDVTVVAVCADYTQPFEIPTADEYDKRVIFFPGSTVGNLESNLARMFFRDTARLLKSGDGMLIGVDLKKDPAILNAAYNDSRGVTAAFNLNILRRINRELQADFDVEQFEHLAFYNEEKGRIEMHLRSRIAQEVRLNSHRISFREGETIHTENSYKYSMDDFARLLQDTGFVPVRTWTDQQELFSVHYLAVP
ncbi:MAG: L-histidine N(alpha)-methyltransferase [Acidobacteriota bacterium]